MSRSLFALAAIACLVAPVAADDRFNPMYRWIPSDVNLFVATDVRSIYASPLATRGKWSTAAPLSGFSPVIQFLLLGSKADPNTLHDHAEYGVAYLNTNLSMDDLAKREGGARDTIADAEAVLSPRNCYFIAVAPFSIGMVFPADRQDAVKWVRFGRANSQPRFSPSIQAGIDTIAPATQFMLVLDLADSVRIEEIRPRLARLKALQGQNLDAAAKVLASIQHLRLDFEVKDAISGTLTVTFGVDVAPIAPAAKALLAEVLARHGAAMDDITDWTAEAKGTTMTFRGPLRESGFRQIVSLLVPPPPQLDQGQVEPNNPLAGEIRLQASQRYFQQIQRTLDGLARKPSNVQRDHDAYALWYEKAADTINQLWPANVDADLLKYGKLAADSLNAIGASARGEQVQITKAADGFRFGISDFGGWGRWGGGWGRRGGGLFLDTNLADVEQAQQEAIQKGMKTRNEIWANLLSETDKIRKAMYDKFKVPF